MSDADCTPGREPRSVAASLNWWSLAPVAHGTHRIIMVTTREKERKHNYA